MNTNMALEYLIRPGASYSSKLMNTSTKLNIFMARQQIL